MDSAIVFMMSLVCVMHNVIKNEIRKPVDAIPLNLTGISWRTGQVL
jgi:hypothetical protein